MSYAESHLAVYLNDHLAGAAAALEMLDTLKAHDDADLKKFATELQLAIAEDRNELIRLMHASSIAISSVRHAVGWIGEKATELKLRLDNPSDDGLRTFELLELIALGIEGKRALWAVLHMVSAHLAALRGADYTRLEGRADHQRAAVETRRLAAATEVFLPAR